MSGISNEISISFVTLSSIVSTRLSQLIFFSFCSIYSITNVCYGRLIQSSTTGSLDYVFNSLLFRIFSCGMGSCWVLFDICILFFSSMAYYFMREFSSMSPIRCIQHVNIINCLIQLDVYRYCRLLREQVNSGFRIGLLPRIRSSFIETLEFRRFCLRIGFEHGTIKASSITFTSPLY